MRTRAGTVAAGAVLPGAARTGRAGDANRRRFRLGLAVSSTAVAVEADVDVPRAADDDGPAVARRARERRRRGMQETSVSSKSGGTRERRGCGGREVRRVGRGGRRGCGWDSSDFARAWCERGCVCVCGKCVINQSEWRDIVTTGGRFLFGWWSMRCQKAMMVTRVCECVTFKREPPPDQGPQGRPAAKRTGPRRRAGQTRCTGRSGSSRGHPR